MDENMIINHLNEMEQRIQKQLEEMRNEIIDEIETSLMEIGVYKKEIMKKLKDGASTPGKKKD